jgi:DNA polymerase IV
MNPQPRQDEPLRPWHGPAILHVDMDAFFASVEQLDHPEWRGKPVIVGGSPDKRGVVAAASYEARRCGVRSAMPAARAVRLCPDAIWTRGSFGRYDEVSRAVMDILRTITPEVQPVSIDEAFLDVTPGAHGAHPVEVARRIRAEVAQLGVTCSVGVATSKTAAKIASDHDKPDGLTVVWPGEEAAFLSPLPVRTLPGIGPVSAGRLTALGVRTLGDLAALDDVTARQVMGSHGPSVVRRAAGIDASTVHDRDPVKSVSNERTFGEDIRSREQVDEALAGLAERVASRLRRKGASGRTVAIKVRFGDFTTKSAQVTLETPTDSTAEVLVAARALLDGLWYPGVGVRLLGVGVSGLDNAPAQLELLSAEEGDERRKALERSVDAVRERFGDSSLGFGVRKGGSDPRDRYGPEK